MNQITEYLGVTLLALALAVIHPALAVGWVGLYLLVSSVLAQMFGQSPRE
jgi:hypothetical protein